MMALDQRSTFLVSSVFFTALLFSSFVSTSAGRSCSRPHKYLNSDRKCRKCPMAQRCQIGFDIKERCGYGRPIQCVKCREEKGFTCVEGVRQTCVLCSRRNRVEKHPCTVMNQAQCGECLQGYYEDVQLDECLHCSEDRENRPECRTTPSPSPTPAITTLVDFIIPDVAIPTKQGSDPLGKMAASVGQSVTENVWPFMVAFLAIFAVVLVAFVIALLAYKAWKRFGGRREINPEDGTSFKYSSSPRLLARADTAVVEDDTDSLTNKPTHDKSNKRKPSLNNQFPPGQFLVVPSTREEVQFLMASAVNSEANSAVSTPSVTPRGLHNLGLSTSNSMNTVEDTTDHCDNVVGEHETTERSDFASGLWLRLDMEAVNATPLQSTPTIQILPPGPGDVHEPRGDRSPVPSTSRDSGQFAGTQTTAFFPVGRHEPTESSTQEPTEDISTETDSEEQPQALNTVEEGQDSKYKEKLETALKKGKDISLKDGLQSYDVAQRLAQILDQGGVFPTDPSYQNVFQALGVPKDKIDSCHKNKTISSPTLSLLQYLESYTHRYEKNMADLISVLHRYEFYEAVMYLCTQVMNFKLHWTDV